VLHCRQLTPPPSYAAAASRTLNLNINLNLLLCLLLLLLAFPRHFCALQAMAIHLRDPPGDILIFMTGARDPERLGLEPQCFIAHPQLHRPLLGVVFTCRAAAINFRG
jgi:hypothetical protein